MSDLIDRILIGNLVDSNGNVHYEDILELPTVEPERKKGRWFWTDGMYACDQCHEVLDEKSPFCPMCGADMKGE